jgi:Tfp pilus assembly ATPase PilU
MEQRSITKMYEAQMNLKKGSDINRSVKIPEALKTDTEKIAWIGDNIHTRLVTIEVLNKMKAKAKEDIKLYEEMLRSILKKVGARE